MLPPSLPPSVVGVCCNESGGEYGVAAVVDLPTRREVSVHEAPSSIDVGEFLELWQHPIALLVVAPYFGLSVVREAERIGIKAVMRLPLGGGSAVDRAAALAIEALEQGWETV
jgi:hypothetical protein